MILSNEQINLIKKLDKETQKKLIKMLYYKVFMEWINGNKMQKD